MFEMKRESLSENNQRAPALWNWRTYASIAIAVGILVYLASRVDLDNVWHEVIACEKKFVLFGMLAHYATYPLRGVRWWFLLRRFSADCTKAKLVLLVFFYNAVDNLVPAKLGDLYGAHLARINCGIRRSAALGSIVFLRMIDAWFVLVLAVLASLFLFSGRLPEVVVWVLIGGGVIAAVATIIMLAISLLKGQIPGWLPKRVRKMIHAFGTGMWPRPSELVPVVLLTVGIWALETLWIFLLALGFGLKLSIAETIFLTMIPVLATAFPITPSGVGVVELTLFTCLRVVGIASPLATSLTVVNRFIDYWLHIGLGILIWTMRGVIGLRTWREVPSEDSHDVHSPGSLVGQEDLS